MWAGSHRDWMDPKVDSSNNTTTDQNPQPWRNIATPESVAVALADYHLECREYAELRFFGATPQLIEQQRVKMEQTRERLNSERAALEAQVMKITDNDWAVIYQRKLAPQPIRLEPRMKPLPQPRTVGDALVDVGLACMMAGVLILGRVIERTAWIWGR